MWENAALPQTGQGQAVSQLCCACMLRCRPGVACSTLCCPGSDHALHPPDLTSTVPGWPDCKVVLPFCTASAGLPFGVAANAELPSPSAPAYGASHWPCKLVPSWCWHCVDSQQLRAEADSMTFASHTLPDAPHEVRHFGQGAMRMTAAHDLTAKRRGKLWQQTTSGKPRHLLC